MRSFEFEREGSPRTPTEEDSGGCLFRLLCNPCFWNASGGSNSCVQGEKRDQDVSSYYESRVGKIRSRIARVLNGGNINVNSNNSGRNSGGKVGVCIDKESYLRWKLRKMEEVKNSSESSDAATVEEDSDAEDDDDEDQDIDDVNDILQRYPTPDHPARKFICVMSQGMILQAVVAIGRTKEVLVLTDGMKLQISYSNFTMTVPVDQISCVKKGMSSGKLTRSFLKRDTESSFHILLRGEQKAATFVSSSTLERDALVHGFQYLLTPIC